MVIEIPRFYNNKNTFSKINGYILKFSTGKSTYYTILVTPPTE